MFQKQPISHQSVSQAENGSSHTFLWAAFSSGAFAKSVKGEVIQTLWCRLTGIHGYVWFIVVDYVHVLMLRSLDHVDSQLPLVVLWCCWSEATLSLGVGGGGGAGEGKLQGFCSGQFASSSCSLKDRLRVVCHDAATYNLWGSVPWCAPCILKRLRKPWHFGSVKATVGLQWKISLFWASGFLPAILQWPMACRTLSHCLLFR